MKYETKMAVVGILLIIAIFAVPILFLGPSKAELFEMHVKEIKASNPSLTDEEARAVAEAMARPISGEERAALRMRRQQQAEDAENLRKAAWCIENGVRCD